MRKLVAVAVVLGVLAAFGLGAALAFAQGPTPTPTVPSFGPGFGMMGGLGFNPDWQNKMHEAVAKALGLTLDQLNAELRAGKTIAQIAQSKNVSLEKLHDDVEAAHEALIQQAVKDGKLTQAQADWMIQRMDAMDEWMDANGGCPGWAGGAGFAPRGGMWGGWYGNNVPPQNFRRPTMGGWR